MSHQERSWVEKTDEATGKPRWDVLINGVAVPGGYVLQIAPDVFEAHYPRIEPFTRPTLAEAKERLEWAPPITSGVAHIGTEVADDSAGFVSTEEAAEALGVSVYRVNAMVSNGKLPARRTPSGIAEVACTSLAALVEACRASSADEAKTVI